MILFIAGNDHRPFQRLHDLAMEVSIDCPEEKIVFQNGHVQYDSLNNNNITQIGFCGRTEFSNYIKESLFVVCHAGAGTLSTVRSIGRACFCLPRLKLFGEHINDHQKDIAERYHMLRACYNLENAPQELSRVGCIKSVLEKGNWFQAHGETINVNRKNLSDFIREQILKEL